MTLLSGWGRFLLQITTVIVQTHNSSFCKLQPSHFRGDFSLSVCNYPSTNITFKRVSFKREKKSKPCRYHFQPELPKKKTTKLKLSHPHRHRFSHFLCWNFMWKASQVSLLITNNPGYTSMPFLQLYFLYCSSKINGGIHTIFHRSEIQCTGCSQSLVNNTARALRKL